MRGLPKSPPGRGPRDAVSALVVEPCVRTRATDGRSGRSGPGIMSTASALITNGSANPVTDGTRWEEQIDAVFAGHSRPCERHEALESLRYPRSPRRQRLVSRKQPPDCASRLVSSRLTSVAPLQKRRSLSTLLASPSAPRRTAGSSSGALRRKSRQPSASRGPGGQGGRSPACSPVSWPRPCDRVPSASSTSG